MSEEVKLLPCPFCGKQPRWAVTDPLEVSFEIQCSSFTCGLALFSGYQTEELAIKAWNTRKGDALENFLEETWEAAERLKGYKEYRCLGCGKKHPLSTPCMGQLSSTRPTNNSKGE